MYYIFQEYCAGMLLRMIYVDLHTSQELSFPLFYDRYLQFWLQQEQEASQD